jgi:hypothetical protein
LVERRRVFFFGGEIETVTPPAAPTLLVRRRADGRFFEAFAAAAAARFRALAAVSIRPTALRFTVDFCSSVYADPIASAASSGSYPWLRFIARRSAPRLYAIPAALREFVSSFRDSGRLTRVPNSSTGYSRDLPL